MTTENQVYPQGRGMSTEHKSADQEVSRYIDKVIQLAGLELPGQSNVRLFVRDLGRRGYSLSRASEQLRKVLEINQPW